MQLVLKQHLKEHCDRVPAVATMGGEDRETSEEVAFEL